jgi:transcriptional regulator with XRE-family HTH domain
MVHANDETAQLLATLKRLFKAAGLKYGDIAVRLGVSEGTVKRYLNRKGLTLEVLQALCAAADISMIELAALAGTEHPQKPPLATPAQEEALSADITLSMTFFLLMRGWRAERIAQEFKLSDQALTKYLVQLDRLGVIALFPQNRVRVLRMVTLQRNSATSALVARRVHELFGEIDLNDPEVVWTNGVARLSEASLSLISARLDRLRDEIFELGEQDLHLPPAQVKWCTVFAAVRPVSVDVLLHENFVPGATNTAQPQTASTSGR